MTDETVPRPDWRDSLALAADLALLGIVATLAALPVVTAGAALATASVAADHVCRHRTLPPVRLLWHTFRRALLPGLGATLATGVAALVVTVNLRALAAGLVPGGAVLVGVTIAIAVGGVAVALLSLVRVGATGGRGWLAAARWSAGQLTARPVLGLAASLVCALPLLLGWAIPVTAFLLPGFLLFALHVATRRLLA